MMINLTVVKFMRMVRITHRICNAMGAGSYSKSFEGKRRLFQAKSWTERHLITLLNGFPLNSMLIPSQISNRCKYKPCVYQLGELHHMRKYLPVLSAKQTFLLFCLQQEPNNLSLLINLICYDSKNTRECKQTPKIFTS